MPFSQTQLPESSHAFDGVCLVDGPPSFYCLSPAGFSHLEPYLICMVPFMWQNKGGLSQYIPLWRYNGAGPNDSKIPIVLFYGIFTTRYTLDNSFDGYYHSIARYLANRGRDVWIVELPNAYDYSSASYINWLYDTEAPWRDWYIDYLFTSDPVHYQALDDYFQALHVCNEMPPIVMSDDRYTSTYDRYIFRDIPAALAAVCHYSAQNSLQYLGVSLGCTMGMGFIATSWHNDGIADAATLLDSTPIPLPPNSIISVTGIAAVTALYDVPDWLWQLHIDKTLKTAYTFRGKLPAMFNRLSAPLPNYPFLTYSVIDTAQLKHIDCAIINRDLPFFDPDGIGRQFYYQLFDEETLYYPNPAVHDWTIPGRRFTTPLTIMYDGNGFDDTATISNIRALFDKCRGYKTLAPFFQFIHSPTAHAEMILGYCVDPAWPLYPKHKQYDYGGTYPFAWYDLARQLPPAAFTAFSPSGVSSPSAYIYWQQPPSGVHYEVWGKLGAAAWTSLITPAQSVMSAAMITGLSSGAWRIKVRAFSLGGSWRDHSGLSSAGDPDDENKWLTCVIA